jgi:SAM-dependent methyltransferase
MVFRTPEWSYRRHAEQERTAQDLPSVYVRPDSVDAWRHIRMLETVLPLVRAFPDATWMTIGDGGYGSDAFVLQARGADVTASSLSDTTLTTAFKRGYIKQYRMENAEFISASDGSYDFILCKESYHHFPRPAIAFYEMLRVARRAVVLIEPIEGRPRPLDVGKQALKKLIRGDASFAFEASGNFLYRVSEREIEKMMTALGGSHIAVKRFNDFFHSRLACYRNRGLSLGRVGTRAGILVQNFLCSVRLLNHGLATIIAFKVEPGFEVSQALKRGGFRLYRLPRNPYAEDTSHGESSPGAD